MNTIPSTTGGYYCSGCGQNIPPGVPHSCPGRLFNYPLSYVTDFIGCICPPGANLQCERFDCPRKREI